VVKPVLVALLQVLVRLALARSVVRRFHP